MGPRVLFLHHTSLKESFGGVEYYMDDLVRYSADLLGAESIHCVYPALQGSDSLTSRETWVRLSDNPLLRKLQRRFSLKWWKAIEQAVLTFKPDLVISAHARMASYALLVQKKFKLPLATVAYGIDVWGNQSPWQDLGLRRASHLFSISEWTKRILVERGHPASQISIIHPGFPAQFENLLPQPKADSPVLRLLTVSRLSAQEQYKGQDHVLQALGMLKKDQPALKVQYTIQGDGTDRARLEALAASLGLNDIVKFAPPVKDRSALSQAYQSCDVFIMPSRFGRWDGSWRGEGFGIVYVEAAAHEVPSIAYDCGGVTDIIDSGKTGWLVPPDNIEALAKQIARLATQPQMVRAAGQAARRHVLAKFSHSAILLELETAISAAVNWPRPETQTRSQSR